jgi:hypothetical protein
MQVPSVLPIAQALIDIHLFSDANCGGGGIWIIERTVSDLSQVPGGFNDAISSYQCTCKSSTAILLVSDQRFVLQMLHNLYIPFNPVALEFFAILFTVIAGK